MMLIPVAALAATACGGEKCIDDSNSLRADGVAMVTMIGKPMMICSHK